MFCFPKISARAVEEAFCSAQTTDDDDSDDDSDDDDDDDDAINNDDHLVHDDHGYIMRKRFIF